MPRLLQLALLLACGALSSGCLIPAPTVAPTGLHSPFTGYSSPLYRDDQMWLCRPDLPADVCRLPGPETEIRADGTRVVVPDATAPRPRVDCFYVYPTVDLDLIPGNHLGKNDVEPVADATLSQVGPFHDVCNLYVPLYRQVTIGTYIFGGKAGAERAEVAFSDVEDAFRHYMGQYNHGQRVVLIGHSQGADMIVRLLQQDFEHDALMRRRLLVALAIGGPVEVPAGRAVGGTFETIPLCTRPDELGCVVAFQSRVAGGKVPSPAFAPKPGNEIACVNPAAVGGTGVHPFLRSVFPVSRRSKPWLTDAAGVETPFLMLRRFYTGECLAGPEGYHYLGVAAAPATGDLRESALDLGASALNGTLGLHVMDFQFPMGDLVELVARRAKQAR
jgi:hypothetical protein